MVCRTLTCVCRAVALKVEHGKLFWAKFWFNLSTRWCLSPHNDCLFLLFIFLHLLAHLCCFEGFSRVFSFSCHLFFIDEQRFPRSIPDSLLGSKPRAWWCPAKWWSTSWVTRLGRECWITGKKHIQVHPQTHVHTHRVHSDDSVSINGCRGRQSDALSVKCCSNAWGMTSQP